MEEKIVPIVVELVFAIFTVIVVPSIKKWLDSKFDEQQLKNMEIVTKWCVYALEQMITETNGGPIRKEEVIRRVKEFCRENKIKVSDSIIEAVIESIVYEMNKEKDGQVKLNG